MDELLHIITQAGLEQLPARIYLVLTKDGEQTVPSIAEETGLSRTSIYEALSDLLSQDLAEYRKEGRNAFYKASHPNKLFGLIEQKRETFELEEEGTKRGVRDLIGMYNLTNKKPGVRFYQGYDDFWKIYNETLTSNDIIYTIEDEDATTAEQGSMEEYDKKRRQKKITQYIIAPNTPSSRDLQDKAKDDRYTQVRIINSEKPPFNATVDLFDGKIIFGTYRKENPIMVVIEDPDIYKLQRHLFETWWNNLEKNNRDTL